MTRTPLPGIREILFPRALVNAFLVDADVLTLIDTGTPGGVARLEHAVRATGRQPRDIARIIVTHRHSDHAGNAAEIARRAAAEVHVSPEDAAFIRDGAEQPRPHAATPLGHAMVPYVKAALPWRTAPVAEVRETLREGARIGPFRVVATPGHTAGHVSLLWEERQVLFAADAAAHITDVGPHPAADDPATARASFARLAELPFESACFGHGRTIAGGAAERFRPAG